MNSPDVRPQHVEAAETAHGEGIDTVTKIMDQVLNLVGPPPTDPYGELARIDESEGGLK